MNLPIIATPTPTPNPPHSQPPPPPPIPTIPYDILTLIIDQLRHDAPTLRACTLTARSWTHRARVHLHRSLTLEVEVQGCTGDFAFCGEEAEKKFGVVAKQVPAVLRYADELDLKCVTSSHGSRSVRIRGPPICTILHLLQHIRVLRIIDADLSNVSSSSPLSRVSESPSHPHDLDSNPSWTTAFPNLENLTLSNTSFRSTHDVVRLASQFKQLRTLRVEDITISGSSSSSNDALAEYPSSEAPTIRNLHILNTTKSPNLPSSLASHLAEGNTDLRRLHIDTTSDLETFTKIIGDSLPVEEMHLALTEEFYPLWHVHPEGKVSNMTAPDVRAAIQPVLNHKGLRVLRLSVQRSPIVRMVQTMEGMGCDHSILCSPWQVYREAFIGLGFASASDEFSSASDEALSTSDEALSTSDEALSTSDEALVGLFGKQEGETGGKEKFKCLELCLSFDARDIQGPRTHISSFESTLRSLSESLSSSNSKEMETNTGKGKSKVGVDSVMFLVKEFIDPVLLDEPARLRRLWGAFVERLRARIRVQGRGDGRVNGKVEVGVEFLDRRDFEW